MSDMTTGPGGVDIGKVKRNAQGQSYTQQSTGDYAFDPFKMREQLYNLYDRYNGQARAMPEVARDTTLDMNSDLLRRQQAAIDEYKATPAYDPNASIRAGMNAAYGALAATPSITTALKGFGVPAAQLNQTITAMQPFQQTAADLAKTAYDQKYTLDQQRSAFLQGLRDRYTQIGQGSNDDLLRAAQLILGREVAGDK